MQQTVSATPLEAVKIEQRPDGQADVWLRKNIQQEEVTPEDGGEPYTRYTADEVHLVKAITQEEAEAAFDELWDEAVAEETPQDERIKALETIAKTLSAAAPQLAQIRNAATLSIQTMAASLTDEQAISVSGLIPAYEVGYAVALLILHGTAAGVNQVPEEVAFSDTADVFAVFAQHRYGRISMTAHYLQALPHSVICVYVSGHRLRC